MNIKKLIMTITSLIIIGCGSSSGDSAIAVATSQPSDKKAELIFSENFDNQQDWTSGSTKSAPFLWDVFRDGASFYPATEGGRDSLEILDSQKEKARGGIGKSLVAYRESHTPDTGWNQFNSDGIIGKQFTNGFDELYVEFWIMFGENFVASNDGSSKIFRLLHSGNFNNPWQNFLEGENGPSLLWSFTHNSYGQRNKISFRGDPVKDGSNNSYYYLDNKDIPDIHRTSSAGDYSFNFTDDLVGEGVFGSDPKLIDQLNGGILPKSGIATHEQVFGKRGTWNKIAFYVKMNSSPGAKDGVFIQWLNDIQILEINQIPWHRYNPALDKMPKWNFVAFGGNDLFQTFPNEHRFEDWYSIDDIKIYNGIPENVKKI